MPHPRYEEIVGASVRCAHGVLYTFRRHTGECKESSRAHALPRPAEHGAHAAQLAVG